MKILIITYYWPPSGGAGVQRWLKLSKYLSRLGVDVHVLTVDEEYASYMQLDHSLSKDIEAGVKVTKTKSFEPINWYARLVGKKNVPTAGFSNVDNNKWSQKMVNFLRTNLFIPDPRKYWKKYAVSAATKIITEQGIDVVVTTSPPHSTQLIGLELKRKLGVKWVADFRDPWTDIYYYNEIGHTSYSRRKDAECEKEVLLECDIALSVAQGQKETFVRKDKSIAENKIHVIPNGYDPDDFARLVKRKSNEFVICYTGTMSEIYNPLSFFKILNEMSSTSIKVRLVGMVAPSIKEKINSLNLSIDYIDTVPHDQINQIQLDADLLLLVIPDTPNAEVIIPGKIFEYLATRNPILGIGPEDGASGEILSDVGAGRMIDRTNEFELKKYLEVQLSDKSNFSVDLDKAKKYSRENQSSTVLKYLKSIP